MSLVCPQCGCESVRLQGGDELEIAFLETENDAMTEQIAVEKKILSENDRLAAEIRDALQQRRIPALNLVSSPDPKDQPARGHFKSSGPPVFHRSDRRRRADRK
jgi:hypothetical protein